MIKNVLVQLTRAILSVIPSTWAYRLLRVLSSHYEIAFVVARGKNGLIEGSLDDYGLFKHYVEGREWSASLLELIRKRMHVSSRGTYIDIGANVGLTTIPLARSSDWAFHAFEPEPENFLRLRLNLIRNAVDDKVIAHNLALSETPGTLQLRRSPTNSGDFRINMKDSTRDSDRGWSFVDVQSIRLDDVLDADSLQRPIILKVDTQGAEPLVFRGGTKIFSQADLVIMEFWPLGMQQLGQNPLDLLQEVKSLYQDFCALDPVSGDTISRSYEEIMDLIKARIADSSSEHFDLVLSAPSYASQASPS